MKKVILFDLDGTLVNSIPTIEQCFVDTCLQLGRATPDRVRIRAGIGKSLAEIFYDIDPTLDAQLAIDTYRNIYLPLQDGGKIPIFADALPTLQKLHSLGHALGVVTTKHTEHARRFLADVGLLPLLSVVVGACCVTNYKPHAEPLLTACARLNITPEKAVYIGDSVHDGGSARAAGMDFYGVTTGTGSAAELAEYGAVEQSLSTLLLRLQLLD